ncbi:MAG TPA: hypothetical protein VGQ39_15115 [Pyrinomonadaceae bacterium]|jgi:hypothetical protein|nr:hypothetical protein [Pyrinomonadaceae bacterium]
MKTPLLKLSIAPSFDDGLLLTLMENRGKDKSTYVLKYEEVERQSTAGSEAVFTLSEEIKVTNQDAERILQILKQASISVAPEYKLSVDGISYELIVSSGLNEAHYKWWETIPKGWETLAEISHAMLRIVGKPPIPS